MAQGQSRLAYLFGRYHQSNCTNAELSEFLSLVRDPANTGELGSLVEEAVERGETVRALPTATADLIYDRIRKTIAGTSVVLIRRIPWRRIAVAASLLLMVSVSAYLLFTGKSAKQEHLVKVSEKFVRDDVDPGGFKARLTLADGSVLLLDSAVNGELTRQGKTVVTNIDGQLTYNGQAISGKETVYNTLTTMRGETYVTVLGDGSKVWLNSSSSITYPVAFVGKERRVEITGEAYFEIAKKPEQPFIASVNGIEVMALGTEFNINAYSDEDVVSTTLIEGSVKVSNINGSTLLKPAQQTQVVNNRLTSPDEVNIYAITAWKNGWFHFQNADLKTILRQFARWYDVEVVYEGPVKNRKFIAIIKRSSSLKNVLEMLQDNDIIYRIEGKKLIVRSG